jgi:guanylate kinase
MKTFKIKPMEDTKIIVVTAPSGTGKSTLCKYLLQVILYLEFSISWTTREKRVGEAHGVNYWYHLVEEFLEMIDQGGFIEYEEVYPGKFYGTPYSEIERVTQKNHHHILLDIDVKGARSVKEKYPNAKIILLVPPSLDVLKQRLIDRGDTKPEDIEIRFKKSQEELLFGEEMMAKRIFDVQITNDNLDVAKAMIEGVVRQFVGQPKAQ